MNKPSEQLCPNGEIVFDLDQRLSPKTTSAIFLSLFGKEIHFQVFGRHKIPYLLKDGKKLFLLVAQVTYLGNPHPLFKKRIQIKQWYRDAISSLKGTFKLIGIYHYKETTIFVDFAIDSYLRKKMHNSSAHVYTNDLYQGLIHGIFTKRDALGNYISSISTNNLRDYLLRDVNAINDPIDKDEKVIKELDTFNSQYFPFNQWIEVQNALKIMHDSKFRKWKETEWPGFFVEYLFDNYIISRNIQEYVEYLNNSQKEKGLDFDLRFNSLGFYGDLKCSNFQKDTILLNDQRSIDGELDSFGRLWFLIYEVEIVKDSVLPGHPYTKKRLEFIRSIEPNYKFGEDDSYSSRLKAKVKFTRMRIIEINKINAKHILKKGTANFHQPDHKSLRNIKYMLNKRNVENAVVYSYSKMNEN